jgi:fibronectin type 3 domain-containing protein
LSWTAVPNATSYIVRRATVSGGPYTTLTTVGITSHADTTVSVGTTYYYVVAASNSGGTSANSTQVSGAPKPPVPPIPTGLTAGAGVAAVSGSSSVTLQWNASNFATSYSVQQATAPAGPWTTIANGLSSASFTQTVQATGAIYYYRVNASNTTGTSGNSAVSSVQPTGPTPSNLTATLSSSRRVRLNWTDRSSDEQGFRVEWLISGVWISMGQVPAGTTSLETSRLRRDSTYSFRVYAYRGLQNTPYSNITTITVP